MVTTAIETIAATAGVSGDKDTKQNPIVESSATKNIHIVKTEPAAIMNCTTRPNCL